MSLDEDIAACLDDGDLAELFLGCLGWDKPGVDPIEVEADDISFTARPIAQKRGLHVIEVDTEGELIAPDLQYRLDARIGQRIPERLVVFRLPEVLVWKWPQIRNSGGVKLVSHAVRPGETAPSLVQRLAGVKFTVDEEDSLSLPVVKARVRSQFSADEVTRTFYRQFEARHSELQEAIEGLGDDDEKRWYASVLMNRLMFIYFFQKKGFLNNDRDFLRSCLQKIRELRGPDEFYAFYRDLLIPMFHDGFGSPEQQYADPEIAGILASVPYVNGGIFEEHELEASNTIGIPDSEFEQIFDFFDDFRWHLDEREEGDPNAINPDVLGYIFEQYINLTSSGQREDGAYYTKEDVTGYMASVTLLPRLVERISRVCEDDPLALLSINPHRYIPEAMLRGMKEDEWIEPKDDRIGELFLDPMRWDELAEYERDDNIQLADESLVETLDRREHVDQLLNFITGGGVENIDDLISHNLDIQTLLVDFIHELEDPREIVAAWEEVTATTVIDPTCGSGAFLFAALDLVNEVYLALLQRARALHLDDTEEEQSELHALVANADSHPNDDYYLLKHATLSNLFGLDIMKEAVEIAKLRLFLTLVSKLDSRDQIEPLPDLDFNIRSGNLLVGFRDFQDARERVGTTSFDALTAVDDLIPFAGEVEEAWEAFIASQQTSDHASIAAAKEELKRCSLVATRAADDSLARAVGIDPSGSEFTSWLSTARPFHWMLEFPSQLRLGGFDVVLGNPPYINMENVPYELSGFRTQELPDLFAPCMERSLSLVMERGRFSMIVPINFQFSDGFKRIREIVLGEGSVWVSTFSRRPSTLFTGAGVRSALVVTSPDDELVFTTGTRRWKEAGRGDLFATTRYSYLDGVSRQDAWFPRTGDPGIAELLAELVEDGSSLGASVSRQGKEAVGFKAIALYYLPVYIEVPPVYDGRLNLVPPPSNKELKFSSVDEQLLAFGLLAGEIGLLWWASTGDDFNVTKGTLQRLPIGLHRLEESRSELLEVAQRLRTEVHQERHLLFTPYSGRMGGAWDLRRVRHLTRRFDRIVLRTLGLESYHSAVLRFAERFNKSTGELPQAERGLDWLEIRRAGLDSA